MTMSSAIEIVSRTDPGKVRSHNEDFVAHELNMGVVLLADGMGGYNAGEVASGMAARIIVEGLTHAWRGPEHEYDHRSIENLALGFRVEIADHAPQHQDDHGQ